MLSRWMSLCLNTTSCRMYQVHFEWQWRSDEPRLPHFGGAPRTHNGRGRGGLSPQGPVALQNRTPERLWFHISDDAKGTEAPGCEVRTERAWGLWHHIHPFNLVSNNSTTALFIKNHVCGRWGQPHLRERSSLWLHAYIWGFMYEKRLGKREVPIFTMNTVNLGIVAFCTKVFSTLQLQ